MKSKDLEHVRNFKINVGMRSNGCSGLCSKGNRKRSWQLQDRELEAPEVCVEQFGVAMISLIDVGPVNTTLPVLFVCRAFRMATTPHMTTP